MQTEIGITDIFYDEQGKVIEANFKPTMVVKASQQLINALSSLESSASQTLAVSNAELVFASWWNKVNEIELADRDQYQIVHELIACERHPNGLIKHCIIKFLMTEIIPSSN